MSIAEEIDGRRIAKDVETRAKALRTVERTRSRRSAGGAAAAVSLLFFSAMGAAARMGS